MKIATAVIRRKMKAIVDKMPHKSCRKIAAKSSTNGARALSKDTMHRELFEIGCKRAAPTNKPVLYDKQKRACIDFAEARENFNWRNIIFVDECKIQLTPSNQKVWYYRDKKPIIRTVKYPESFNVFGGFSVNGMCKLMIFKENVDSTVCVKLLKDSILPFDKKYLAHEWFLLQDKAPCHRSKAMLRFFDENSLNG